MEVRHLLGHSGCVNAVRFTQDGLYAVSAGDDHAICIHALRDGSLIRRFDGHSASVLDVAVTPDGRYVVSGSVDGTVRLWQTATGREVTRLTGPDSVVRCVDISPDGRYVVAGTESLWVWRLHSRTLLHCLHPYWMMCVFAAVIMPDSRSVMMSGERRIPICTLDLSTGRTLSERADSGKSVDALAVSPDGRLAAAWCEGGGIEVWRRRSGQLLFQCSRYAYALAFTMDGNYLVSAEEGAISVYTAENGIEIVRHPCKQQPHCLAVSNDGRYVLIGNQDGSMMFCGLTDLLSGQASAPLPDRQA